MARRTPMRIADYFFVIGHDPDNEYKDDPLSFLGKKGGTISTPDGPDDFPGTILQMLPSEPHRDVPVPEAVHLFAFPTGFGPSNTDTKSAEVHAFVQTDETSRLRYGIVLTVFETSKPTWECKRCKTTNKGTDDWCNNCEAPVDPTLAKLYPKALVLTSYWPFIQQFGDFLVRLYSGMMSDELTMPIERIILNLIMETPVPPSGKFAVHFQGLPELLTFMRPSPNQLESDGFEHLFKYLSLDSVLQVMAALMTERKVLLVAQHASSLYHVSKALTSLLFPFSWQLPFIPLLPAALIDFIYAPVSYMIGVLSSYSIEPEIMEDVIVINLENGAITINENTFTVTELPATFVGTPANKKTLQKLVTTFKEKPKSSKGSEIAQMFAQMHVRLFGEYKAFIEMPAGHSPDQNPTFEKQRYLGAIMMEDPEAKPFLDEFLETQMFSCFISDRYDERDQNHKSYKFLHSMVFDEMIEQDKGTTSTFLSDTSDHRQEEKDVTSPGPDAHPDNSKENKDSPFYQWSPNYSQAGVWPRLDKRYEGKTVPAEPLFDEDEDSDSTQVSTISNVANRFFQLKHQFSSRLQALSLQNRRQGLGQQKMVDFFKQAVLTTKTSSAAFTELASRCGEVQTRTSLDPAWHAVKALQETREEFEDRLRNELEDSIYIKMSAKFSDGKTTSQLLFDWAVMLEKAVGKRKYLLDRAHHKAEGVNKELLRLHKLLPKGNPSARDMTRQREVETYKEKKFEADDTNLALEQAKICFESAVEEYEDRVPELIASVRALNMDRIATTKGRLQDYASTMRSMVQRLSSDLELLESKIDEIDAQKDQDTYTRINRQQQMRLDHTFGSLSGSSLSGSSFSAVATAANVAAAVQLAAQRGRGESSDSESGGDSPQYRGTVVEVSDTGEEGRSRDRVRGNNRLEHYENEFGLKSKWANQARYFSHTLGEHRARTRASYPLYLWGRRQCQDGEEKSEEGTKGSAVAHGLMLTLSDNLTDMADYLEKCSRVFAEASNFNTLHFNANIRSPTQNNAWQSMHKSGKVHNEVYKQLSLSLQDLLPELRLAMQGISAASNRWEETEKRLAHEKEAVMRRKRQAETANVAAITAADGTDATFKSHKMMRQADNELQLSISALDRVKREHDLVNSVVLSQMEDMQRQGCELLRNTIETCGRELNKRLSGLLEADLKATQCIVEADFGKDKVTMRETNKTLAQVSAMMAGQQAAQTMLAHAVGLDQGSALTLLKPADITGRSGDPLFPVFNWYKNQKGKVAEDLCQEYSDKQELFLTSLATMRAELQFVSNCSLHFNKVEEALVRDIANFAELQREADTVTTNTMAMPVLDLCVMEFANVMTVLAGANRNNLQQCRAAKAKMSKLTDMAQQAIEYCESKLTEMQRSQKVKLEEAFKAFKASDDAAAELAMNSERHNAAANSAKDLKKQVDGAIQVRLPKKELKVKQKDFATAKKHKDDLKRVLEDLHKHQSTCERTKAKHVETMTREMEATIPFFDKMTFANDVVSQKMFFPACESLWKYMTEQSAGVAQAKEIAEWMQTRSRSADLEKDFLDFVTEEDTGNTPPPWVLAQVANNPKTMLAPRSSSSSKSLTTGARALAPVSEEGEDEAGADRIESSKSIQQRYQLNIEESRKVQVEQNAAALEKFTERRRALDEMDEALQRLDLQEEKTSSDAGADLKNHRKSNFRLPTTSGYFQARGASQKSKIELEPTAAPPQSSLAAGVPTQVEDHDLKPFSVPRGRRHVFKIVLPYHQCGVVVHIIPQTRKELFVSVVLKHGQGASQEACQLPTEETTSLLDPISCTSSEPLHAAYEVRRPGVLEIILDNRHARFSSKNVKYAFSLNNTAT